MAGWSIKASMPSPAAYPILAAQESTGKVFALAGTDSTDVNLLAHRSYDPVTNTWTSLAAFPVASRAGHEYVNAGASNFAFGTYNPNDGGYVGHSAILSAYQYNISTNTWTAKTTNPGGARVGGSLIWNGADLIYWIDGSNSASFGTTWYSNTLQYSISGNSWTTLATFPNGQGNGGYVYNASHYLTGTIVNGDSYLMFGLTNNYDGALDVSTGTLTTHATQPNTYASYPVTGSYAGNIYYTADESGINQIIGTRSLTSPYIFTASGPRTPQPASSITQRSAIITGGYLYSVAGTSNPDTKARTGRTDQYQLAFPNTPVNILPANSAVVNNDLATLSADVVNNGEDIQVEWNLARDASFLTNLKVIFSEVQTGTNYITGAPTYSLLYVRSGTVLRKLKAGTEELFQGTWYLRCRGYNAPESTPWSATTTFTVSHAPAVSLTSPQSGTALLYGTSGDLTFNWAFSDTSETDYQTAYQIIVERNDTGTLLLDTGKVASQSARQYSWSLPAANKDYTIRWKMRVWDSDDVAGNYTAYSTFSMSDSPVVNITAPAEGSQVNNGTPTVTWTFTASGGRTQSEYRVRFYATNNNTLQFDSGWVLGNALSYTPSQQAVGVGSFYVRVDVRDGGKLEGYDTNNFSTTFDVPAEPGFIVSASTYATSGYVQISWSNAEKDYAWKYYRVYRRLTGVTLWALVYETDAIAAQYDYHDYSAGSGVQYDYIVVQVGDRFSQNVESTKTNPQTVTGFSDQYWLVDQSNSANNMLLSNVVSDSFKDEWESAISNVIGRGRHKDVGTHYGNAGTLECKFRGPTARAKRLALLALQMNQTVMYLRNPFGDVWKVALDDMSVSRISGVGTTEMCDVSIPYEEVS